MGVDDNDDWSELWSDRLRALESVLGESDDRVLHGAIPFYLGFENGGTADVVSFSQHFDGVAYVTADLIGCEDQKRSELGNYELMICHREESEWGPGIVSRLAHYTLETAIEPGHTMDSGPATPKGSTIAALLFDDYATFDVRGELSGLLLCFGITARELKDCRNHGSETILEKLKDADIYPFTDLYRDSVV
jgi:hypothetical protein